MAEYLIGIIVGSIRKESFNAKLALALSKLAPKEFNFKVLQINDLPLYNQDDDNNPSESVKRLKSEILACQGLLFATPEYNRSIPGILKNALDHASRPYGQSVWKKKPAAIIGASVGATGTALAQQHLRNILSYLDVPLLGQPEVFIQDKDGLFDESGNIGPASKQFLQNWMDAFVDWIKKHA
ncbi:MAG: NADPH-dependent FMN reductase [Candidatus Berkiella sp.]